MSIYVLVVLCVFLALFGFLTAMSTEGKNQTVSDWVVSGSLWTVFLATLIAVIFQAMSLGAERTVSIDNVGSDCIVHLDQDDWVVFIGSDGARHAEEYRHWKGTDGKPKG